MAQNKTSLSAGQIIRAILLEDPNVSAITTNIFPVVADKAVLPYISYRRVGLIPTPAKAAPANDEVNIEVLCYAPDYGSGVALAEAVRGALDGVRGSDGELTMRSCYLNIASEGYENDAYVQQLIFKVKI